jgi:hypothetical protein
MIATSTAVEETDAPTNRPHEVLEAADLPPPKPLKNTLERLEALDDEVVLVQRNDRVPQHLFPQLDDRGYEYENIEDQDEVVTAIWRDASDA